MLIMRVKGLFSFLICWILHKTITRVIPATAGGTCNATTGYNSNSITNFHSESFNGLCVVQNTLLGTWVVCEVALSWVQSDLLHL
jgi:hypothetical protein